MKIVYKIIYTILLLPGIIIFWILIATLASEHSSMTSDYFSYGLAADLGRTARWSFPVALLAGFIVLIIIWSSGKRSQNVSLNEPRDSPKKKRTGSSSGEYQDGNPYS